MARFEEANPGVTIDAQGYAPDEYKTKLKVALGTEAGPDVFHTWCGGEFQTYVDAGQVLDLSDPIASGELAEGINPGTMQAVTFDDAVYGIPVTVEASMIWYRPSIFEDLGLEVPTTWDEFLNVIEVTKGAGLVPIATANSARWPGTHWWSEIVAQTCGPDFVPAAAAGEASFEDPCVVSAHEYMRQLVDVGAFNEGFNGLDYDSGESRRLFWSGEAAMNHMGNWLISAARDEAPEVLDDVAMFTVPEVPDAQVSYQAMTGGSNSFAVSASAVNPDLAVQFLAELTGEAASQDIAAGGRMPVWEGTTIDDPVLQQVVEAIAVAPAISPWPDQFLAPAVAEVLLTQSQAVFGGESTPEEAASALQAANEQAAG